MSDTLRFATWNVNSARARVDRICAWLEKSNTDVLAIQETKCKDNQFPADRFTDLGFEVAHLGANQWNGVALLSRVGIDDVQRGFPGQPEWSKTESVEPRAIGATCAGVTFWSLYVPNGRTLDDPHYAYKLEWLDELANNAQQWLESDPEAKIALTGDWNIAPLDEDVWDIEVFRDATHVSEPERRAYERFLDAGYKDVVRPFTPGPGVYTYWDYTQLRFPRREGMRIDHILTTPALADCIADAHIDRDERKGKGASDHAPVVVDIKK
ncbi:exodeoxyribonuclease III [Hoyosella rhizosphaerae]|uniref:Exodeoxyribonuclease III protein XthA n=1 Tax=Hoyosella rhizosphaerae TaxID=1755582 RepID=A0A916U775_9ACTN|nr:exodeoxyribonuclease III [Hoyosella rhizosphaerae]MBN4927772.1 exodeoxyribonuclease III [Hoyosella rhizosphaerae]GGC61663.1 putative exodeoxyribonuclease III protein XthA [Hoyosella rhizosphaerae]